MRRIREAVLPFTGNNDDRLPKTVREYRQKYKGVSRILDGLPEVVELLAADLKCLSSANRRGRAADFSVETILRALVVHAIEGGSLRETVVRIISFRVSCAVVLACMPSLGQSVHINAQASSKPRAHLASTPDPGSVTEGVYRNAFFGFSCKIPFGWVERTAQMQEGSEPGKSLASAPAMARRPQSCNRGCRPQRKEILPP